MAAAVPVALLDRPDKLRVALSPIRRQLLARLAEPTSASALASELGVPRQRLNYHLRALEDAGLLSLVETRQKRGFLERVLVATAGAFVVDPDLVRRAPDKTPRGVQDRFAAEHLVETASGIVRNVTRMQAAADQRRKRLLTFTIETDVQLGAPEDVERFSTALSEALARTVARFARPSGGRRYRVVLGGYPTPRSSERTAND